MKELGYKGNVTLTLRDADTLEVIESRDERNHFTQRGVQTLAYNNIDDELAPIISTTAYGDSNALWRVDVVHEDRIRYDSKTKSWTYHDNGTDPHYWEIVVRFNQPTSTRSIRNVMLNDYPSGSGIITRVQLDPPCEQTATQILDVTYRLYFVESTDVSVMGNSGRSSIHTLLHYQDETTGHQAAYQKVFPGYNYVYNSYPLWNAKLAVQVDNLKFHHTGENWDFHTPSDSYDFRLQRMTWSTTLEQADYVGRVIGSVAYGAAMDDTNTDFANLKTVIPFSTRGPQFPNTPIQNIHNHSASAVAPFLDVNHLAVGTGTLSLNGDAWTNPDYPKYLRFEMTSTGETGVARYSIRRQNTIGYSGNSYASHHVPMAFVADTPEGEVIRYPTIRGGHGLQKYSGKHTRNLNGRVLMYRDLTGITFVDVIDASSTIFDATTTPSLPVSNIREAIVDNGKDIWVADTQAGLFRIANPLGVATITHFSNATHGIPVGGDVSCLGVCVGKDDKIWAAFDGGICSTTDAGVTWTIYDENSTHPFSYVGISDGNWTKIRSIKADQESDEIGILQYVTASTHQVIWWSDVDAAVIGPLAGAPHMFGCSIYGGFWVGGPSEESSGDPYYYTEYNGYTYGSTAFTDFSAGNNGSVNSRCEGLTFMYDYHNNPHAYVQTDYVYAASYARGFVDRDRNRINDMRYTTLSTVIRSREIGMPMHDPSTGVGKGLIRFNYDTHANNAVRLMGMSVGYSHGTLNYQHSVFEENTWDKMQWNGTDWELNYHHPAVDTSGNANDAIRHNFDVESYFFTGRSNIDFSNTFGTGVFGTDATFAVTLNPSDKLTSASRTTIGQQEQQASILEVAAGGDNLLLTWDGGARGGASTMSIFSNVQSGAVVTVPTPAAGGTYRVVATVSATDAKVYLDGTLIMTLLLSSPIDLSNPSSTGVVAKLGSTAVYSNGRPMVRRFFRGNMTNVQCWTGIWDQAAVTSDMLDIGGVITPPVGSTLITRFEMTQSLDGTETKTTHVTDDPLWDGLTNSFADGALPGSFVAGEYYTVGVADGLLKDNATSLTHTGRWFDTGTSEDVTTIAGGDGGSNIVPAGTITVTEPAMFGKTYTKAIAGQSGVICGSQLTNYSGAGAWTMQSTSGDFECTFTLGQVKIDSQFGLSTSIAAGWNNQFLSNIDQSYRFVSDNTLTHFTGSTTRTTGISSWAPGDTFVLAREGTTMLLYKYVIGVKTLIHTSAYSISSPIAMVVNINSGIGSYYDMSVTYEKPAHTLQFGNSTNGDGLFNPNYLGGSGASQVLADGVELDVVTSSTPVIFTTEPAPGTCTYNYISGAVMFNSAEVGKTITGYVTVVNTIPQGTA